MLESELVHIPLYLHLDLKGAPPTLRYLRRLLPWIKSRVDLRGIIVEYEDQFPFQSAELSVLVNSSSHWTTTDVADLQKLASALSLDVIPLVQTIGHLEYVLKHPQFAHLREIHDLEECLSVVDESLAEGASSSVTSVSLVAQILREVLDYHPDCTRIHIGGDEVWHLAKGAKSSQLLRKSSDLSPADLFLRHMEAIVAEIKKTRPNLEILMWDDMLRNVPLALLQKNAEFLRQLSPVVWQYTPNIAFPLEMWTNYASIFPSMMIASAFKGASSSCARVPPIKHHVDNHLAWLQELKTNSALPRLDGLILTGWQRFDHYAGLCELLPCGVPSLICCVKAFRQGGFSTQADLQFCAEKLGIRLLKFTDGQADPEMEICENNEQEPFPGIDVFLNVQKCVAYCETANKFLSGDYVATWCSDWHFATKKVSVLHGRGVASYCQKMLDEGRELERRARHCLEDCFPLPAVDEWIDYIMTPILKKLGHLKGQIEDLGRH